MDFPSRAITIPNNLGLPFGVFLSHKSTLLLSRPPGTHVVAHTTIIEHSLGFCAYPRGVVC